MKLGGIIIKNFLSNPAAVFTSILLLVTLCVASIPFINRSKEEANVKSLVDGQFCCMCGDEATNSVGISKFYCADCYDKEYGDVPIYRGSFH